MNRNKKADMLAVKQNISTVNRNRETISICIIPYKYLNVKKGLIRNEYKRKKILLVKT